MLKKKNEDIPEDYSVPNGAGSARNSAPPSILHVRDKAPGYLQADVHVGCSRVMTQSELSFATFLRKRQ